MSQRRAVEERTVPAEKTMEARDREKEREGEGEMLG